MEKIKVFLALFLFSTLLVFCSSDDTTEQSIDVRRLVKAERASDRALEHSYNSDGYLSTTNGTSPNATYTLSSTYNSDNQVIEWKFEEIGWPTTYDNYNYDTNGLLTSYDEVNVDYNGNIVTLTGKIEGDINASAILELNSDGLIVKFTEFDRYTTFEYDSNGNMIWAKSYDNSDNLQFDFTITYDNKINPFYGQFESIYFERFIEFFWEFDGIYVAGYGGYAFPFLKNNITSISRAGGETTTYSYIYDSENYPTSSHRDTSGDTFTFDIEYY